MTPAAHLLAASAAAVAVLLLAPHRPRLAPVPPRLSRWGALVPLGAVVALLTVPLAVPRGWVVPGTIAVVAGGAGRVLWLRRRARVAAHLTSRRVLETCAQLASELSTGQPPGAALVRAAEDWSELWPVAEAFRVGSDVPTALRTLAARPGADDLRLLAAAWHVAHRTGQGLADAVDRVTRQLVDARATRRVVDGELSSARSTARLIAVLPVAALAMGSGAGGDPVGFLLHSPAGWLCLAAGLAFGLAGLWWIEALARGVDRDR